MSINIIVSYMQEHMREYCCDIASIFHSHIFYIEQYLSIASVFRYYIFDLLFILKEYIYDTQFLPD